MSLINNGLILLSNLKIKLIKCNIVKPEVITPIPPAIILTASQRLVQSGLLAAVADKILTLSSQVNIKKFASDK